VRHSSGTNCYLRGFLMVRMAILQRPLRLGLVVLSLLAPSHASAQVVKCVDAKGRANMARRAHPEVPGQSIQRPETPTPARPPVPRPLRVPQCKGSQPTSWTMPKTTYAGPQWRGPGQGRWPRWALPVEQLAGPSRIAAARIPQQQLNESLVSGQRGIVVSRKGTRQVPSGSIGATGSSSTLYFVLT
jgi:hypothetical protein